MPGRPVAPLHRGPQALMSPAGTTRSDGQVMTKNAALLIDFDNVTMGIRSDLHSELKTLLSSDILKGKPAVQRAYADWRRYPQYVVPLAESSIDMIMAPAYGTSKKNATDIRLAIDALELVFTRPDVTTFILLSGDSDFSSLVIKLKEYGKYVIGIGIRESSSDLLVMNCDEYYSYNALAGLVKNSDEESTRWDPWELVTESVTRMKRNGDVMRSDRLKQVMQEIDNSFDEKDLGAPKFSRFVQDAAHRGLLKVTKLESGQLEIDLPEGSAVAPAAGSAAAPAAGTDAEQRRDRDRERDRGRRGRRGRGRDRDDRGEGERDVEGEDVMSAGGDAADDAAIAASVEAATVRVDAPAAPAAGGDAPDATRESAERGRGRDRGRGRGRDRAERAPRADETQQPLAFGESVAESIGTNGERLTRSEAFDLVRRAVESLVQGEDSTSASAVRQRAYETLGRDSESLSARNFERVLQDAHDAGMIDLRRRGNDFEVARAADAPAIVEQLKTADQALKAAAAASAPPAPPRGMSHRGVAPRGMGRGKGIGPSPELLMVGVVPRLGASAPAPSNGAAPVAPPMTLVPDVAAPTSVAFAPPLESAILPDADVSSAPARRGAARTTSAPAATPAKSAGRGAAKAPAKKAAKVPAKTAAKSARGPAKPAAKAEGSVAAKKAGKAPAKKAAKAAKR